MGKDLVKRKEGSEGGAAETAPAAARFGGVTLSNAEKIAINAVGQFIQRRAKAAANNPKEGNTARLTIRHVIANQARDRVDEAPLDKLDTRTAEECDAVALTIYQVAANHANNCGKGEQKYLLQWFTEAEPNDNPYTLPFAIKAGQQGGAEAGGYIESYPPTAEGQAAMAMKFAERLMDKVDDLVDGMAAPLAAAAGMLKTAVDENTQLRSEIRGSAASVDEAKTKAWDRDEKSKENKAKRKMWKGIAKGIDIALPAVAKRIGLIDKNQPISADNAHVIAVVNSLVNRDAFDDLLTGKPVQFTTEEIAHLVSTVQAHLAVDEKAEPGEAAKTEGDHGANGKSNGKNGTARQHGDGKVPAERQVQAPAPTVTPEMCDQQIAAWVAKKALLAPPPAEKPPEQPEPAKA